MNIDNALDILIPQLSKRLKKMQKCYKIETYKCLKSYLKTKPTLDELNEWTDKKIKKLSTGKTG